MGWLSILLMIIQYGPQLFTLVSEIIEMIKKRRHPEEQKSLKADLADAVSHYRLTGDRGRLRALRDRLKSETFGA